MKTSIKRAWFSALMVFVTAGAIFVLGELVLRIFSPVEYLYPRYKYSPKYGFLLFENRRMVHHYPRHYKFHYTVNKYGYRGEPVELAASYDRPNIVVLGDSYSFGIGVNDGDEYATVLDAHLDGEYNVVNLGNPGWGLTQHIRRYYDFGALFHPEVVILQFCANDPEDNFNNMVTRLENGEFKFVNSGSSVNWIKKYLSNSIIQKSQLYNFFRRRAYLFAQSRGVRREEARYETHDIAGDGASKQEEFYSRLLERFARELNETGVLLVMIAVNEQLDRHPHIKEVVYGMHEAGKIKYVEIVPWFETVTDYVSQEGHWQPKAHGIIAAALADSIRAAASDTRP